MTFHSCDECGGQCCRNFGIPEVYRLAVHYEGVPICIYRSDLNPDPRRYLELHFGIIISEDGERFTVARDIPIVPVSGGDKPYWLVQSVCTKLGLDGRCTIYDDRPEVCRNFTEATMEHFHVPDGCKYTANAAVAP